MGPTARAMILAAAGAASLAWAGAGVAEPAYVTAAELERAAAEVRNGGAPSRSFKGRRFQLTIVPRQRGPANTICHGYPNWGWYPPDRYEVTGEETSRSGEFFLDARGAPAIAARSPSDSIHLTSFACRYERDPKRMVENMYGEMVELEPTREDVLAIAHVSRAETPFRGFTLKTDERGRQGFGERIVVRISGGLGEWLPGRSIVCGSDRYESLGAPMLVGDFSGCLVNGYVDLIEYIDAASGEVRMAQRVERELRPSR